MVDSAITLPNDEGLPHGHHARAGHVLLPFGIMEKHGPHLPLGNDLFNVPYAPLVPRPWRT